MSKFAKKIEKLWQAEIEEVVKKLAAKFEFDEKEAFEVLKEGAKQKTMTKAKRPSSAYIRYCTHKRPELKKANPDLSSSQILTELGRLWKALSEEEKQPFIDEYEAEMNAYKSNK